MGKQICKTYDLLFLFKEELANTRIVYFGLVKEGKKMFDIGLENPST